MTIHRRRSDRSPTTTPTIPASAASPGSSRRSASRRTRRRRRARGRPDRRAAGDDVVDIGCGPGVAVRRAAAAGRHRRRRRPGAGDASRRPFDALDGTRRRNVSVPRGSAESLPVADGAASVVWSLATVHHWQGPRTRAAEVRRSCGRVAGSSPSNGESRRARRGRPTGGPRPAGRHVRGTVPGRRLHVGRRLDHPGRRRRSSRSSPTPSGSGTDIRPSACRRRDDCARRRAEPSPRRRHRRRARPGPRARLRLRHLDAVSHLGDSGIAVVVPKSKTSADDEQLRVEGVDEPGQRPAEVLRPLTDKSPPRTVARRPPPPTPCRPAVTALLRSQSPRPAANRGSPRYHSSAKVRHPGDDETEGDTGPDGDVHEARAPRARTQPRLADCRRPHVGFDDDRNPERGGQVDAAPVERCRAGDLTVRADQFADPDPDWNRRPSGRSPADRRRASSTQSASTAAPPRSGRVATRIESTTAPRSTSTRQAAIFDPPMSIPIAVVTSRSRGGTSARLPTPRSRSSRSSCGTRTPCPLGGSTPRRPQLEDVRSVVVPARTCMTPERPKITSSPPRCCIELTPPGERLRLATVRWSVLDSKPIRASPDIR